MLHYDLNDRFKKSGKTKTYMCRKMKVSRPRLDTILNFPETATWGQAETLSAELSINDLEKKLIFLQ